MPTEVTQQAVEQALKGVQHPDLNKSIVELNMVDNVAVCDGNVRVDLVLASTADPVRDPLFARVKEAIQALEGVSGINVGLSLKTPAAKPAFSKPAAPGVVPPAGQAHLPGIRHIIAISSGKGGVGKTSVTVNLAAALAQRGHKVGILDADVYGPNVPIMLGLRGAAIKEQTESGKLVPPENYGIKVMSIGFIIKEEQPVVWRGPMLDKLIRQFLTDTNWGELDYLLVDLPPGTGDAQLTIMQAAPLTGAIIVTTPQVVALHDSRKGLAMFQSTKVPLLGIIENMSYFVGDDGKRYELFGHGGGRNAAEQLEVPFLGEIPLVAFQREQADQGVPVVIYEPEGKQADVFRGVAEAFEQQVRAQQPASTVS